jgi:DNA-binding NtrC family response regulator
MGVPATEPAHPLHLALAGYEHEWPADFEAFVARELIGRDGALVARLAELAEAPAFLSASEVTALIVNASRLGLKGKVALRECRRVSPSTAVVVVATTAVHGLKDALEGGATAFVSWPASPEVVRQALLSGRDAVSPASRTSHHERGGVGR